MSSAFEDDFAAAGAADLFEVYGEAVTVGVEGGAERPVTAIVERMPPAPAEGRGAQPAARITFRDHATLGIDAAAFNAGRYYVRVATTTGGAAKRLALSGRPIEQGDGLLVFSLGGA